MLQARCAIAVFLVLGAALARAAGGAEDGLARCAGLESADERLSCYDDLARTTPSPAGGPVDPSSKPSHLTEDWKLSGKDRGVRHLTDILEYRPNYVIARWTNNPNDRPASPAPGHQGLEHVSRGDFKIQGSFKTELVSRQAFEQAGITQVLSHVGFDSARLWFGYTQKMNWQAFNNSDSRPIRETNYEPEAILTLGTGNQGNGFKLVNLGLSHESNGLQQAEHRGWNRAYAQGGWEWDRLSVLARVWQRIPESSDDNPDISDFMGRGDIIARYQTAGGYVTSLLVRRSLPAGRGYVQVDWATPLLKSSGALRFHVQVSSGYGETLIDYNHEQTTIGIGVSFGDW